jgi:hypothetical protein
VKLKDVSQHGGNILGVMTSDGQNVDAAYAYRFVKLHEIIPEFKDIRTYDLRFG